MKIRKLPDKLVYAGKIESWLKDMAAEGLILKRMGEYYATFKQSEPEEKEYRICAYDDDYFVDEVMPAAEKAGWRLIKSDVSAVSHLVGLPTFRHNKYYIFEKPVGEEPDARLTPLHTNGWLSKKMTSQKNRHKKLKKYARTFLIIGVLGFLLFYGLYFSGIMLTIALFMYLLALLEKKEEEKIAEVESRDIHEYQTWSEDKSTNRTKMIGRFWLKAFILFYALLLAASPAIRMLKFDLDNVPNFIRLEDVQNAYENDIKPTYGMAFPSPFVPVSYKAMEQGVSKDADGNVKRVEYEITYSKSIIPFVSKLPYRAAVFRKLSGIAQQYMHEVEYTSTEYFDKVAYVEFKWAMEMNIYMVAVNNSEIVYIRYRGNKTLDEVVENIENRLK